jgi:hypothetical protein
MGDCFAPRSDGLCCGGDGLCCRTVPMIAGESPPGNVGLISLPRRGAAIAMGWLLIIHIFVFNPSTCFRNFRARRYESERRHVRA